MYQFILKVLTLVTLITILTACDSSSDRKEVGSTWVELDTLQATDPVTSEPEVVDTTDVTVKADTNTDPCAPYRDWIQEGVVYMCVYACGGQGPCTPTFTNEGGCAVQCDPEFYEYAERLKRVGDNQFIYNIPEEDCPATCTPVQ